MFLCSYLFCYTFFVSFLVFAIILTRKRVLVALLILSFLCLMTVKGVLRLFLNMSWVALQCVIVVFPDHTYFLFK